MKTCRTCKHEKPLSDFYRDASSKDGRYGLCIACDNSRKKAWRIANPGKDSEYDRTWKARNPNWKPDPRTHEEWKRKNPFYSRLRHGKL